MSGAPCYSTSPNANLLNGPHECMSFGGHAGRHMCVCGFWWERGIIKWMSEGENSNANNA